MEEKIYPAELYPYCAYVLRPKGIQNNPSRGVIRLQEAEREVGGEGWPPPHTRIVGPGSSNRDIKAVEHLVSFFMQETPWDFRPFCSSESLENARVVLLLDEHFDYWAIGAIGFRHYKLSSDVQFWNLNWAWLHPFLRSKGKLRRIWPALQQRFGEDFMVEHPVSGAMQSILTRTGHSERMKAFEKRNSIKGRV